MPIQSRTSTHVERKDYTNPPERTLRTHGCVQTVATLRCKSNTPSISVGSGCASHTPLHGIHGLWHATCTIQTRTKNIELTHLHRSANRTSDTQPHAIQTGLAAQSISQCASSNHCLCDRRHNSKHAQRQKPIPHRTLAVHISVCIDRRTSEKLRNSTP